MGDRAALPQHTLLGCPAEAAGTRVYDRVAGLTTYLAFGRLLLRKRCHARPAGTPLGLRSRPCVPLAGQVVQRLAASERREGDEELITLVRGDC